MAELTYPAQPIAVDDTLIGTPDGITRIAKDNPDFPGELFWDYDVAANDAYNLQVAAAGATISATATKTEIVVAADVANDHADGTVITDPFDATLITLEDGTVDNQIVQIHRDGAFAVAVDAKMTLPDTGIEIHTDHEIGRLQWDAAAAVWNDITNDRGGSTAPVNPTIDTVMSGASTNAVENQAIVNTLASDTGTLTLNGGVF